MTTAVKEGTLTILEQTNVRRIDFNGIPEEREQVRDEFDRLMASGGYLAFMEVKEAEGTKNIQIRQGEFPIDQPNPRVTLMPHLKGG